MLFFVRQHILSYENTCIYLFNEITVLKIPKLLMIGASEGVTSMHYIIKLFFIKDVNLNRIELLMRP